MSTWASITKMRAPQPPKIMSESNVGSKKSTLNKKNISMNLFRSCETEGPTRKYDQKECKAPSLLLNLMGYSRLYCVMNSIEMHPLKCYKKIVK
jgi:hypothetical protein